MSREIARTSSKSAFERTVPWPLVPPRSDKYAVISKREQQSVIGEAINRRVTLFVCTEEIPDQKKKKKKGQKEKKKASRQKPRRPACYKLVPG